MYIIAQSPAAAPITVSSGAATTAFNVIAGEPGAGTQDNLNAPGSNKLNGQPFTVRAAGNVIMAAGTYTSSATPISFVLYAGNTASFAAAVGNGIFSATAAIFTVSSAVTTSIDWEVDVQVQGNNSSGKLCGRGEAFICYPGGAYTVAAIAALAVNPSSVNFAAEPPVQFTAGIVTADSNLLNIGTAVANLTSFVIEA